MSRIHHQFSLEIYKIPPIPKPFLTKTVNFNSSTHIHLKFSNSATLPNTHQTAIPVLRCSTSSVSVTEEEKYHSSRIFIRGLAQSIAEGFLQKTFSRFGKVNRVKIIMDKKAVQSLGFAYVWFTNEDSAQLAVKEMNGKFFCGRFIDVTIAKPESPSSHVRITPYKF